MPDRPRDPIEYFKERLDWLFRNATPDSEQSGIIADRAELHRRVIKIIGRDVPDRTWARYMSTGRVSPSTIAAIHQIYPSTKDSRRDLLTCSWSDFESYTVVDTKSENRWKKATELFNKQRKDIERLGKYIYKSIDETPDSPLIGLKSWIPERPILIFGENGSTRNEELNCVSSHDLSQNNELKLPGLNVSYHILKIRILNTMINKPFNGNCYVVKSIRIGNNVTIAFGLGDYFSYINTCEAHAALLADLYLEYGPTPTREAIQCSLDAAEWAISSALNWNSRNSFLGINCLLIIRAVNGTDRYFLHRRTGKTVEAQGVWHVVPAGGHQPLNSSFSADDEIQIWHTAIRELLEEVFGCEDLEQHNINDVYPFSAVDNTRYIYNALTKDNATKILYLGMGLDPATLKPECMCTIVIDWDKAYSNYIDNRRANLRSRINFNWEGKHKDLPLSKDTLLSSANNISAGEFMLPAGGACLALAAHHFEDIMS